MRVEDTIEVYVVGEMNIYKAEDNKKTFQSYLTNNKNVILDLSNVTEFDTAGLQILMAFKKSLDAKHKNLYLRAPSELIINILKLLKMDNYFEVIN